MDVGLVCVENLSWHAETTVQQGLFRGGYTRPLRRVKLELCLNKHPKLWLLGWMLGSAKLSWKSGKNWLSTGPCLL